MLGLMVCRIRNNPIFFNAGDKEAAIKKQSLFYCPGEGTKKRADLCKSALDIRSPTAIALPHDRRHHTGMLKVAEVDGSVNKKAKGSV